MWVPVRLGNSKERGDDSEDCVCKARVRPQGADQGSRWSVFVCVCVSKLNPIMMVLDLIPDGQAGSPASHGEGNHGVGEM